MVALETNDNQLDFSTIEVQNVGKEGLFKYSFKQFREVNNRKGAFDKIVKHAFIVDKKATYYGIALRESGAFDLYWDMTIADSNDSSVGDVTEIGISFDTMYFLMKDGNTKAL